MNLIFNTADVLRSVEHSLQSKDWSMGYEDNLTPAPGLLLVHDTGVYLMSNGRPGDYIPEQEMSYVSYAEGCNPRVNEDYYEVSRDLVGGDDFAEVIPINKDWIDMISKYEKIHIELTPEELSVSFSTPKS